MQNECMRARLSEDVVEEVNDRIRDELPIPPSKLSFEDRLEVLLDQHDQRMGVEGPARTNRL